MRLLKTLFLLLPFLNCKTAPLKVISRLPKKLKEASAIAYDSKRDLYWTIQDSNNDPILYALDENGKIRHETKLFNIKNKDWEDLIIDEAGNFYIGDFGNNDFDRNEYYIYKIEANTIMKEQAYATVITFKLQGKKEKDFEAFILKGKHFYLFSKEKKKTVVYYIPNHIGKHKAIKVTSYLFGKKKDHQITSATISKDQKTVFLLNHSKFWQLSNFENDQFFSGDIKKINLYHDSQKEGICFKNENTLLISDEYDKGTGGNLYELKLTN